MTYGENVGAIRDELIVLLQQHRIQLRLGAPGRFPLTELTTVAERQELGRVVQRYRDVALTWAHQALEAVSPKTDVDRPTIAFRSPVDELRHQLGRSRHTQSDGRPLLDLLATSHRYELVTGWQRIARAAALGEHDFTTDVNLGWLTSEQARTVAKDAADVVRGVVVLDDRYRGIPGWRHLPESPRLNRCAETVSRFIADQDQDLGVDARGWRPPPATIAGPGLSGVAGAVQAQHNVLVDLAHFPEALNLRRLLHAQALVSHEAARHAVRAAPDLVERFLEREQVYRTLVQQSRGVGGLIGGGGPAVAESQNAVSRLQRTAASTPEQEGQQLRELARLFTHTDARLASTIERGLQEKLYFVSVKVPRMTDQKIDGVTQPRTRWMPVCAEVQTDMLAVARNRLRPAPALPPEPAGARLERQAYEAALTHRPAHRRTPTL